MCLALSVGCATIGQVSEETWRPLGVETDEEIAEYDALHDGVPDWMCDAVRAWVRDCLTTRRSYMSAGGGRRTVPMLDTALAEQMCQTLRIRFPNLRQDLVDGAVGRTQLAKAMVALDSHPEPLQIVDYLLAFGGHSTPASLEAILVRGKSAWTVGERAGRPGLVRRVPLGVQVAADAVMGRTGRAGVRLAKAWEKLYGLDPDPSAAYVWAVRAVEDAVVPVVSPNNTNATLGTVVNQMVQQGDWRLPMDREHQRAPSPEVLVGMLRMFFHGQVDRHGGQLDAPDDVSVEEATVAVSLAVTLVNLFESGLVSRTP